jgi:hypothetical protein
MVKTGLATHKKRSVQMTQPAWEWKGLIDEINVEDALKGLSHQFETR